MKKILWFVAIVVSASSAAQAQDSIFTVDQKIEIKVGGGWRPCTVTDPGGATRNAYADCPEFVTPGFTYAATVENFIASGSMDVRMPGSCQTTSRYAITRKIPGCRAQPAPAPVN